MKTKQQLIQRLKQRGAFWSYQIPADSLLPDAVIISECLVCGDVPELLVMFQIFGKQAAKLIWKEKLLPIEKHYARNYYLAAIFFDIENPGKYILPKLLKSNRYERIKQFTA